jgi:ubiquinone/menaquinone biosynthesis C-methylase UbiE
MIELAETAERADAAGIEYHVSDARNLRLSDQFDFVIAAYLLNYARSAEVLLEMAETIASNLKAGGRFITVNNNPRQRVASFASTRKYGFVKTTEGPIRNGSPIQFVFFNGENSFEVENYHLDADIHRAALTDAGFSDVQWHSPKLSLAEAVGPDPGAWSDFLEDPPVVLLTCTKAALRVAAAGASKQ